MVNVFNIHAQTLELCDKPAHLLFVGIASHVSNILERRAAKNFINRACNAVGDSDLCFVGRAEPEYELVVFSSVK